MEPTEDQILEAMSDAGGSRLRVGDTVRFYYRQIAFDQHTGTLVTHLPHPFVVTPELLAKLKTRAGAE